MSATSSAPRRPSALRLGMRLVIALAIMAAGYVASRNGWIEPSATPPTETHREQPAPEAVPLTEATAPPVAEPPAPRAPVPAPAPVVDKAKSRPTLIRNVVIRDEDGKVAYRGDVDLADTLERIAQDKRLRFRNDGSVFQNRERRLPSQASGYYREWVHPTPKLSGPGPQRIVTGEQGEVYYTPDHYKTFQRIE